MAPEQAEGRLDQLGPATDVYGLGAILYEILTGGPPFAGPETTALLRQVIHEAPARPRSLVAATPPPLEAVCLKALAKKPADRYAAVPELAHEIQCFLADEPVRAFAEPLSVRAGRWVKKHRTLVSTAAALLVTAVVGLTIGTLLLSQANRRTQQQRDRADENFRTARRTVDDYLTRVSENKLLKSPLPGLQPLRKELLESALAYHEQFLQEHGDDPGVQAELAASRLRVGKILDSLGFLQKGQENLELAVRSYQELLQAHPEDPSFEKGLAESYLSLGYAQLKTNRKQAVASFRQAVSLAEKLARTAPQDADGQFHLGKTYHALAQALGYMNEPGEALSLYTKALDVLEGLVKAHPAQTDYQGVLAMVYLTQGALYQDILAQPVQAQASFERGLAIDEKLFRTSPDDLDVQDRLATFSQCLGVVTEVRGKMPAALALRRRGAAMLEKLMRENPRVVRYQAKFAFFQREVARTLRIVRQPREAMQALEQARTVAEKLVREHPAVSRYRETLALVYNTKALLHLELGQPAEARQCSQKAVDGQAIVIKADPANPRTLYYFAQFQGTRGGIEGTLGHPGKAVEDFTASVALLEKLVRDNPRHRAYQETLRSTRLALNVSRVHAGLERLMPKKTPSKK
jgi:tetratricopeptide (TPR) repeat protein